MNFPFIKLLNDWIFEFLKLSNYWIIEIIKLLNDWNCQIIELSNDWNCQMIEIVKLLKLSNYWNCQIIELSNNGKKVKIFDFSLSKFSTDGIACHSNTIHTGTRIQAADEGGNRGFMDVVSCWRK